MKKLTIVAATATLLSIWGCTGKSISVCDDCNANSDTFTIRVKHNVTVFNCCADAFPLTFNRVTEDSRCPIGVECIWEGLVKINIITGDSSNVAELLWGQPKNLNIRNRSYSIRFITISPNKFFQQPLDTNAYEAKIAVTRQ